MAYEHILIERQDGVGIVTLNRPEALNAMNRKLGNELLAAVKELEAASPRVKVRSIGKTKYSRSSLLAPKAISSRVRRSASADNRAYGSVPAMVMRCSAIGTHLRRPPSSLFSSLSG